MENKVENKESNKIQSQSQDSEEDQKNEGQEGEREPQRWVFGSGECGKQRGVGVRGRRQVGAPRSRRTARVAGF